MPRSTTGGCLGSFKCLNTATTRNLSSIDDRGPTDRVWTFDPYFWSLTLTSDLYLQSHWSYSRNPFECKRSKSKVTRFTSYNRTDGWTDRNDCITSRTNATTKYSLSRAATASSLPTVARKQETEMTSDADMLTRMLVSLILVAV